MSSRPKRKRSQVNYSETSLANQFNISGRESSTTTEKKTRTSQRAKKTKRTTAQIELKGQTPYRGNAANKSAPVAEVLEETAGIPKRNKRNELLFPDYPEFRPNLTPKEVMQLGSFGGTYFRPITSGVTGESYRDMHKEFPADWFEGLDIKTQVTSKKYRESVNKYQVKCGGSLDMWEGSGWISAIDPYGWFHWYCRFYLGRRSTDDKRQISRANGVAGMKGRFRNQLIGKCARGGKRFDDVSVSPVIRQAIQHWGYQLTQHDADYYVKHKKLPKLPR